MQLDAPPIKILVPLSTQHLWVCIIMGLHHMIGFQRYWLESLSFQSCQFECKFGQQQIGWAHNCMLYTDFHAFGIHEAVTRWGRLSKTGLRCP
ncbi:hypothetical protein AN477_15375 [Alicyclobacillus ferrooxydans]|uniref:Uncharacterized protein n=1 Tax=Alicyclobacillus ferrooxydans TaxID=471514 RepID=A0A0P9CZY7_9BACL|nr:hypothetical protein AN477_15375 [Alicyclobacillus ferrooxydans]